MLGLLNIVLVLLYGSSAACASSTDGYSNSYAVNLFQEYIRINTTTHNNFTEAVEFWKTLAAEADVPMEVFEFVEGYPVLVLEWTGTDPSLNSIMLNSHMDVVPATYDSGWSYNPFSGYIDENGDIYGRGTQDMKSVSIQYYTALCRLKANNVTFLRNVYMTLMPDEEVGAEAGMIPFLESSKFTSMNVGIELDEGTPFPLPFSAIFYQDKVVWQIQVDCYGISGHGSTFPETNTTATGKCLNVMNRLMAFRDEQYEISKSAPQTDAGGYSSINLNKLSGGTANNVIPSHVSLIFDIRLGTTVNEERFNASLYEWVTEAGDNVTLTYIHKNQQSPATVANSSNPYWNAIVAGANAEKLTVLPTLPPGSTDARHVRNKGFPAFGFSPMPNTPLLLHSDDEHLNVATFTAGIEIYEKIIDNLANIPADLTTAAPSTYVYDTAL